MTLIPQNLFRCQLWWTVPEFSSTIVIIILLQHKYIIYLWFTYIFISASKILDLYVRMRCKFQQHLKLGSCLKQCLCLGFWPSALAKGGLKDIWRGLYNQLVVYGNNHIRQANKQQGKPATGQISNRASQKTDVDSDKLVKLKPEQAKSERWE